MGPRDHEVADDAQLATDPPNQAELQTLADMLRGMPPLSEADDDAEDSECQRILQLVERIGVRPQDGPASGDDLPSVGAQQLGHYRLLAKLGQGGMGAVYKALHTKLDKLVALKVLPAERLQDAAAVARFEREMRAVGKLNHENIVAAHDAGEIGGTHYLVMELVDGADVSTIAREQAPLPVADACEIIRQAALGLQHAHANNLVHRDIKPSNLMLAEGSSGPVVKILDMGLALLDEQHTEHPDLTASGQIMGTLDYMAPEQAGDTHTVDIRADIYSLGATLYKLLTGRVPFQGPQYTSTVKKLVALATQAPPRIDSFREDLPAELVEVVHRMLAREPEDRYATPRELAEAMAPFAAGANLAGLLDAAAGQQDDGEQTALLQTVAKGAASVSVRSSVVETQSQVVPGRSQPELQPSGPPKPPRRFKRGVLLACAAVPILLGVILLSLRTPHGEIVVELADGIPAEAAKHLKIEVTGNGELKVADASAGWTIDVAEGKYQARLSGGADQFQLEQNRVTVTRGEKAYVKVTLKPLGETPTREQHAGTVPTPAPTSTVAKTWQPTSQQQEFFDHVAALPAEKQAAAVAKKLMEVNPGFNGKINHQVTNGAITHFWIQVDEVTNIWPVRALPKLISLVCYGTTEPNGKRNCKFADIAPLQGMRLEILYLRNTVVSDLTPLAGMPLRVIDCTRALITDLSPLTGMPLRSLTLWHCPKVSDLSPLVGAQLAYANLASTPIADISPLKGIPLAHLSIGHTSIEDLSPLAGAPLKALHCSDTKVSDLSALVGAPLEELHCHGTNIDDLTPLKGMPLKRLYIERTPVTDLSPVQGCPLEVLSLDHRLFDETETALLKRLGLIEIRAYRGKPTAAEFWQEVATRQTNAKAFAADTAKLPPDEQVAAIRARLNELNPETRIVLGCTLEDGAVSAASLYIDSKPELTRSVDVTPLMSFSSLTHLTIGGGKPWQDISCLQFVPLEELYCDDWILFKNIATLKNMPSLKRINGHPADEYLAYVAQEGPNHFAKPKLPPIPWDVTPEQQAFFDHVATLPAEQQAEAVAKKLMEVNPGFDGKFEKSIQNGQVVGFKCHTDKITNPTTDVWPIRALPALKDFWCRGDDAHKGNVTNLNQLRGMRLTSISVKCSPIRDLSPLIGMPLSHVAFHRTSVADLSPLQGMPLEHVQYDVRLFDEADETILRSLPLRMINGGHGSGPAFWQEIAQRRNAAKAFAAELSQLPPVKRIAAVRAKLDELNGANRIRLTHHLNSEKLAQVEAYLTGKASDITPLMALADLKKLSLYESLPWQDLSCLKFLPLEELTCSEDALFKNQNTLRGMKTLRTINGMPAEQFWSKLLGE